MATKTFMKRYVLVLLRGCLQALVIFVSGTYYKYFCSFRNKKVPPVTTDILLLSAMGLANGIRSKSITSSEVAEAYIARILEINPLINAMVAERFDEARKEAAEVDRLIEGELDVGLFSWENRPFLGVPFTVKECLQVKGLPNTSGSYYRKNVIAGENAMAVQRLVDAGAIPLGITNLPELGMFGETYNLVYGLTRNPYDLTRTVGGSSGGEAALIAACGSPFGLASDIGGSIRRPAFFNGIFGHKPTARLVSTAGQFPNTDDDNLVNYNTVGLLCRSAEDLGPLLKILAGPESSTRKWAASLDDSLTVHYLYDTPNAAFATRVSATIRQGLTKAVEHLRTLGASIVPCSETEVNLWPQDDMREIWTETVIHDPTHDFCSDLLNGDERLHPDEEFSFKNWLVGTSKISLPGILLAARSRAPTPPEKRNHLLASLEQLKKSFQKILNGNAVFLFPTCPETAPYHYTTLFANQVTYTGIINLLGLPSTQVPLGLDKKGMPYGIQVVGNHHRDDLTIAVARELEKAFGGWTSP